MNSKRSKVTRDKVIGVVRVVGGKGVKRVDTKEIVRAKRANKERSRANENT